MTAATLDPTTIRSLSEISRDDVAFAGKRGVQLAARVRADPSAPRGFVVGAPAYAALRDAGDLRRRLVDTLDGISAADRGRMTGAALRARSLVAHEPLPARLNAELEAAYRALVRDDRDALVTVRPSETTDVAGDDPSIEARGTGAFLQAVRRCWGSLYDPRRVYARAQDGRPQVDVDVAVVVQRRA